MNSFGTRSILRAGKREFEIYRLDALEKQGCASGHLPFSLRILLENLLRYEDGKAVKADDQQAWNDLLIPTKIYVRDMKALLPLAGLVGAAHITGGGLYGNIERVLPAHLQLKLDWTWSLPRIFEKIERDGNVERDEMIRVFNMGIGLALVVSRDRADAFATNAQKAGVAVFQAGSLEAGTKRLG